MLLQNISLLVKPNLSKVDTKQTNKKYLKGFCFRQLSLYSKLQNTYVVSTLLELQSKRIVSYLDTTGYLSLLEAP